MRRILLALIFAFLPNLALAWNAAGHRLVAVIAWHQLSPASRDFVITALARHPDYANWAIRAKTDKAIELFAEASTWPDDIRSDPRFHDEEREPPTPAVPGLADTARHKRWHYLDLDPQGKVVAGEIDRQIERLSHLLRSTSQKTEISTALPWLIHLVADIHQPLHVGRHGDEGGNEVEIENPFNKRLPFSSLHVYWDDLPGPPWLRHKRLIQSAGQLLETLPPPEQGTVADWREESHALLDIAYPEAKGSLLPLITEAFHQQSRAIANRRIVDAGYRLGRLLDAIVRTRVSRETP